MSVSHPVVREDIRRVGQGQGAKTSVQVRPRGARESYIRSGVRQGFQQWAISRNYFRTVLLLLHRP